MKAIMMTVRLWWFYLTYKGIKTIEIRKRFTKDFKGKIFEYVSKTNWKKDLMKIPEEEREFFKQFVGKVGLYFECDKVEEMINPYFPKGTFATRSLTYETLLKHSCLGEKELDKYINKGNRGYAIHITKLEIFDKPKEISEFIVCLEKKHKCRQKFSDYSCKKCVSMNLLTHAPQSFCFIEV